MTRRQLQNLPVGFVVTDFGCKINLVRPNRPEPMPAKKPRNGSRINKLTEIGNINPVHMGVVIIVTLTLGLITPPYGIALLSNSTGERSPTALATEGAPPVISAALQPEEGCVTSKRA